MKKIPWTRPLPNRLSAVLLLMRLDRPVGTLLLLWPALWGLWLAARGHPPPSLVGIFVAGTCLMRSAGCVINDMADCHLDPLVQRTCMRPLAARQLSRASALCIFLLLLLAASGLLFFVNLLTRWLAVAGALLAIIYPFLKRFTHLPQAGLGVAFAWSIPMAFSACQNTVPPAAFWLFGAAFCWIFMYDTQYAMADRAEDLRAGIRSSAILFGKRDCLVLGILQMLTLLFLLQTGLCFALKPVFYFGVFAAGLLFVWQQWHIRDRLPAHCLTAFSSNPWVGALVFAGLFFSSCFSQ